MKIRTICNPINISYCYQKEYSSRESADPAVVIYKGEYYLFASHGEGYWISKDLVQWEFIKVDVEKYPEFKLFAPGPCVVGERIYITHSEGGSILYSDDPRNPDSWVDIGRPYYWNDPALWYDKDGYVYVYEGCSTDKNIAVAKLDPNDNMRLVEGPVDVCGSDRENRGYERRGNNHELDDYTFFEGAWVSEYNGKYYMQCAVPGTEFDVYADGYFVSDHPMGPFTYCENSPVSFKSTGFLRGCGHGCLFEDLKGNWWKIQTNDISVNHIFERRISIYPAKYNADGRLYVNTLRSDYPMMYPHDNPDPFHNLSLDWHVLSYGKAASASSTLDDAHVPAMAADEHMATWWSAKTGDAGEWFALDLGKTYNVTAIQINFADQGVSAEIGGRGVAYGYKYILEISVDGKNWETLIDRSRNLKDMPHDYVQISEGLEDGRTIRYLKITNLGEIPAGGLFAISDLRVFGPAQGEKPEKAPEFAAIRGQDTRDMMVSIDKVPGAQGYYIRLGIEPDDLHIHYQIMDDQLDGPVRIGCLTRGISYYVTVDAYNEAGITKGQTIQKLV